VGIVYLDKISGEGQTCFLHPSPLAPVKLNMKLVECVTVYKIVSYDY